MDNIKKFEDFLGRMQGLLDNAKKQGHIIVRVEDLESTFPELKESEDERIRKGLIKAVSRTFEGNTLFGTDVTREEALAWLEKQGRQKHALSEEDEEHIDSLLKRLDGLCRNEFERTRFAISEDGDWLKSLIQRIGV